MLAATAVVMVMVCFSSIKKKKKKKWSWGEEILNRDFGRAEALKHPSRARGHEFSSTPSLSLCLPVCRVLFFSFLFSLTFLSFSTSKDPNVLPFFLTRKEGRERERGTGSQGMDGSVVYTALHARVKKREGKGREEKEKETTSTRKTFVFLGLPLPRLCQRLIDSMPFFQKKTNEIKTTTTTTKVIRLSETRGNSYRIVSNK